MNPKKVALHQRLGLWLGLLILGIGLFLLGNNSPAQIPTEHLRLDRTPDQPLIGRLYRPVRAAMPYPTLMLWHGVSCTKEIMEPLAVELARSGIAVLAFDAGGFGESYSRPFSNEENLADAKVIAAYVKAHPEQFDIERLGVGGHSMGGATAIALAIEDVQIQTTISLGMSADVNWRIPPNLLMGIGLYEEFHTPFAMRTMLQQGTGQPPRVFQLYGDFSKGTARKLVISPTSDHLMEPFDPLLIRETVAWANQSFNLPPSGSGLIMPSFIVGWFLTFLGVLLSWSYGVRNVALFHRYPRLLVMGMVVLSGLLLWWGMSYGNGSRVAASLILLIAAVLPICVYGVRFPDRLTPVLRLSGLYTLVILLAYTLVALLLRADEWLLQPVHLLSLPQFMLQMPMTLLYSRVYELRAAVFSTYSQGLVPHWTLLFLFLPELIRPGVILEVSTTIVANVAKKLRQPLQLHWSQRPSRRSLQLLGGLVLVFIVVSYQQVQSGIVSWEAARSAVSILMQLALLPAVLMIGMLRSPLLQKLELQCLKR